VGDQVVEYIVVGTTAKNAKLVIIDRTAIGW
jgi:hypothetical protein